MNGLKTKKKNISVKVLNGDVGHISIWNEWLYRVKYKNMYIQGHRSIITGCAGDHRVM